MTLHSTLARGGLALALATAMANPAAAQFFNANYQLAIPLRSGVATPTLDGVIDPAEWSGSILYRMEDGAPLPAASMRALATTDSIWFGFSTEDNTCDQDSVGGCVLNDYPLFGSDDVIVVGYNIDGTTSGYRRLHIQPCAAVTPNGNKCPVNGPATSQLAAIKYWKGSADALGNFTWTPEVVPAGIEARTASAIVLSGPGDLFPSRGTWSVELKLPRTIASVPAGGFGLFVDVIPTNPYEDAAIQYAWPSDRQIAGPDGSSIAAQIESTPPPKTWGVARLDGLAAGVSIAGFGSNGTDPTKISLTEDNEFHATLANGTAATATNLVATFRIANWGVTGGPWAPINTTAWTPAGGGLTRSNPTPPVTLNQNDYWTVYSGLWNPTTTGEAAKYSPPNDHQCIRVDVIGDAGVSTSRQFNMDFVNVNSPFNGAPTITLPTRSPLIDMRRAPKITLREQFINVEPQMKWKTEIGEAKSVGNGNWVLRANPNGRTLLNTTVLVDDNLRLVADEFRMRPENATGMVIPVRPGSTITLFASGAFQSRLGIVTPDGLKGRMITPTRLGDRLPSRQAVIRPGALIGSFDDFQTSFVIRSAATLQVPKQARVLKLRLATVNSQPLRVDGRGYFLKVVGQQKGRLVSIPEVDPTLFGRARLKVLPLGANLPAWVVRAEVDTGRFVTINKKTYQSRLPLGSFGSFITNVRQ